MSTIIDQEGTPERKPRRQRVAAVKVKADSASEIASLQAQLQASQELLQTKTAEFRAIQEDLKGEIRKLESHICELRESAATAENDLCLVRSSLNALAEETSQTRNERDQLLAETQKLAAELREVKLDLAKTEMHEWRSIGRRNSWKRCFAMLTRAFRRPAANNKEPTPNKIL